MGGRSLDAYDAHSKPESTSKSTSSYSSPLAGATAAGDAGAAPTGAGNAVTGAIADGGSPPVSPEGPASVSPIVAASGGSGSGFFARIGAPCTGPAADGARGSSPQPATRSNARDGSRGTRLMEAGRLLPRAPSGEYPSAHGDRSRQEGARVHALRSRGRGHLARRVEGPLGRAVLLSQGRHARLNGGGARVLRGAVAVREARRGSAGRLARHARVPREVPQEALARRAPALGPRAQGHDRLRRVGYEDAVRPEVRGRDPQHGPHRPRRQGRAPLEGREGRRARGAREGEDRGAAEGLTGGQYTVNFSPLTWNTPCVTVTVLGGRVAVNENLPATTRFATSKSVTVRVSVPRSI